MDEATLRHDLNHLHGDDKWGHLAVPLDDLLDAKDAEIGRLLVENADLKINVVAFCGPWAVEYAKDHGYPPGHLAPEHYSILARAGARMDDFVCGHHGKSG